MTEKKKVPPRKTPSRDEFYLGLAYWISAKSKDPRTQCGALIISDDNLPLGMGYNGPSGKMPDSEIDWDRPEKYPYIIHAEINAINRSDRKLLNNSTIYVTGKPCSACALDIVDAGIKRVVYFPFKSDSGSMLASPEIALLTDDIFRKGSVVMEEFADKLNWMRDRMLFMETLGIF